MQHFRRQRANERTFFLDEIGELPMFLPAKLLRALRSKSAWRSISRNGEKKPDDPSEPIRYEADDETSDSFRVFGPAFREKAQAKYGARVAPDYTTVVDGNRRYVEVSDSFCELVGSRREELIGKQYDELTAPGTNNIPVVFELFARTGYMHGLWVLVNRAGVRILVQYEAWIRPVCKIQSVMELVDIG